jgi:Flagellar hook-length control protein FliK
VPITTALSRLPVPILESPAHANSAAVSGDHGSAASTAGWADNFRSMLMESASTTSTKADDGGEAISSPAGSEPADAVASASVAAEKISPRSISSNTDSAAARANGQDEKQPLPENAAVASEGGRTMLALPPAPFSGSAVSASLSSEAIHSVAIKSSEHRLQGEPRTAVVSDANAKKNMTSAVTIPDASVPLLATTAPVSISAFPAAVTAWPDLESVSQSAGPAIASQSFHLATAPPEVTEPAQANEQTAAALSNISSDSLSVNAENLPAPGMQGTSTPDVGVDAPARAQSSAAGGLVEHSQMLASRRPGSHLGLASLLQAADSEPVSNTSPQPPDHVAISHAATGGLASTNNVAGSSGGVSDRFLTGSALTSPSSSAATPGAMALRGGAESSHESTGSTAGQRAEVIPVAAQAGSEAAERNAVSADKADPGAMAGETASVSSGGVAPPILAVVSRAASPDTKPGAGRTGDGSPFQAFTISSAAHGALSAGAATSHGFGSAPSTGVLTADVSPGGVPAHAPDANPYQRLDQNETAPASLLHSSGNRVAVGVHDPALGWVEIDTQSSAGQVSASLVTASSQSHASLASQLPSLTEYLAAHEVKLSHIGVEQQSPGANGMGHHGAGSQGTGAGYGNGREGEPGYESGYGQDARHGPQGGIGMATPAASEGMVSGDSQTLSSAGWPDGGESFSYINVRA